MHPDFADIRTRIATPPLWYDEAGTPRYDLFHPKMLGIYDTFAILGHIACQSCHWRCFVGRGWSALDFIRQGMLKEGPVFPTLVDLAEAFNYGDPPRHDCPGAGETMTSELWAIAEAWEKIDFEWTRRPDLERLVAEEETC